MILLHHPRSPFHSKLADVWQYKRFEFSSEKSNIFGITVQRLGSGGSFKTAHRGLPTNIYLSESNPSLSNCLRSYCWKWFALFRESVDELQRKKERRRGEGISGHIYWPFDLRRVAPSSLSRPPPFCAGHVNGHERFRVSDYVLCAPRPMIKFSASLPVEREFIAAFCSSFVMWIYNGAHDNWLKLS